MGQKVNPRGIRIGITDTWRSRWFATKTFAKSIGEDLQLRKHVKKKLSSAGISKIEIERTAAKIRVNISTAKPGLVIGKKGKDIEDLRRDLKKLASKEVVLNILETKKPDADAQLIADGIAFQLERRISPKRAMKEAVSKAMKAGAEGVKVRVSGRLNGAEIARTEGYREGRVPLHTLRADIDYATGEAKTTYGIIGVKIWVFKGEKFAPGEEKPVESIQL